MKAIIYPDAAGEWRFHIRADNGEIIAHGESYVRRTDAEHVLKVLFQSTPVNIEIHDHAGEVTHSYLMTASSGTSTDEQLELPVQDAGEGE